MILDSWNGRNSQDAWNGWNGWNDFIGQKYRDKKFLYILIGQFWAPWFYLHNLMCNIFIWLVILMTAHTNHKKKCILIVFVQWLILWMKCMLKLQCLFLSSIYYYLYFAFINVYFIRLLFTLLFILLFILISYVYGLQIKRCSFPESL